jgi:hypothetical protein
VKQPTCDVFLYSTADDSQFVTYQLAEDPKTVTDTYTGDQQAVRALTIPNAGYCAANSTQSLVNAGKCDGNLSAPLTGDEAYVSVSNVEKPLVTLNIPALN